MSNKTGNIVWILLRFLVTYERNPSHCLLILLYKSGAHEIGPRNIPDIPALYHYSTTGVMVQTKVSHPITCWFLHTMVTHMPSPSIVDLFLSGPVYHNILCTLILTSHHQSSDMSVHILWQYDICGHNVDSTITSASTVLTAQLHLKPGLYQI